MMWTLTIHTKSFNAPGSKAKAINFYIFNFFRECTDTKNKLRYAANSSAKGNYTLGVFRYLWYLIPLGRFSDLAT